MIGEDNKEGAVSQKVEANRMMYYDANNVGYVVQNNGPQWQEMTNNNLAIQRQLTASCAIRYVYFKLYF
jgi:hypothetical protein